MWRTEAITKVETLNFNNFHIFILFPKIQEIENWMITTMSILCRNVPTRKYSHSKCIYINGTCPTITQLAYFPFVCTGCRSTSTYMLVHFCRLWTLSLLSNFLLVLFLETLTTMYMKIVKFNTLTFLLKLQLAIYNLFLYLKDLTCVAKKLIFLSKIIEKKTKKKKTEDVWSVGFIPLETINLSLKNNYKSDLNFLSLG